MNFFFKLIMLTALCFSVTYAQESVDTQHSNTTSEIAVNNKTTAADTDINSLSMLNASIRCWFGYIGLFIVFAIAISVLTTPKQDKRFKTGYKNNAEPLAFRTVFIASMVLYPFLLGAIYYFYDLKKVICVIHTVTIGALIQ